MYLQALLNCASAANPMSLTWVSAHNEWRSTTEAPGEPEIRVLLKELSNDIYEKHRECRAQFEESRSEYLLEVPFALLRLGLVRTAPDSKREAAFMEEWWNRGNVADFERSFFISSCLLLQRVSFLKKRVVEAGSAAAPPSVGSGEECPKALSDLIHAYENDTENAPRPALAAFTQGAKKMLGEEIHALQHALLYQKIQVGISWTDANRLGHSIQAYLDAVLAVRVYLLNLRSDGLLLPARFADKCQEQASKNAGGVLDAAEKLDIATSLFHPHELQWTIPEPVVYKAETKHSYPSARVVSNPNVSESSL
ncbi:hypothetical protein PAPHI01_1048 [Pancytospora philotis]|nr:hypothetical protein PAPHI01_1048 [Pancytospora philotis]